MRLYDYPSSGNCYKVRALLALLGRDYERVHVDIFDGGTLTEEFGALNPARTTPVLVLDSGEPLVESNAILVYLADGSALLPDDALARAQVVRWLIFEQTSIVPTIGSLRVRLAAGVLEPDSPGAERRRGGGLAALGLVEGHLEGRDWLVGDAPTIADLAIYGYVHVAGEAGIDLSGFPAIGAWIERVEAIPGHVNDLEPIPPETRLGVGRSIYG